ncbi:hypothetical protein [Phenylobacterium soli]|uniref:Uncharacterized protein n=1 Tax=Phenylobacterium soli TaxID=2170551 RepID=A0A328AEF1_9CAUL|nr:hypothetical protein [Phenylobacterium soli]RAK53172.1 hypothetical protein DJ017_00815 [Phenylobacterium soli]
MGQVVPFIRKVSASGAWTEDERARLAELGERLIAAGLKVEVIYGVSEEGDPWCVVKDEHEDVLIHVARIGGVFVIHHSFDDSLREGEDLPAMLGERLAWEETRGVVMPFSRQAQSILALIVATAFFYETAGRDEPDAPSPFHLHLVGGDGLAAHAASALDVAPLGEAAHDGTAAALPPSLVGSAASEWRSFALEDDGALPTDHGAQALAAGTGGPGGVSPIANLEVAAPAAVAAAPVVLAFEPRLAMAAGPGGLAPKTTETPTNPPESTFVGAGFVGASFRPTATDHPTPSTPEPQVTATVTPANSHWVDLDLDGDGRPDVRVLVPDEARPAARPQDPPAPDHEPVLHEPILAVGHGFPHAEFA